MGRAYSYRVAKKKSRSLAYLVLAVILAFAMFKWGLPFFIDILAGPGKDIKTTQNDDKLPPQTPILSALPEATNSASLAVEGFTEVDAEVILLINDEQVGSDRADKEGAFSIDIKLNDGENRILVKARDMAGNESES
ncbi:hypothetical protein HYZ70_02390, partial [Candidatus Curtissbacteria bacterium]|nr:hypothetical protein [Candidatus Curtissbacteria bacterium]